MKRDQKRVYSYKAVLPTKERIIGASPTFFLTAAEHSGDALGASLIHAVRRRIPQARFVGVGGDKMAAAGCRLLANPVQRSAMLVGAFVTQSWYWWKLLAHIRRELATLRPNVVVPIDSSAINLRIAAMAKNQGLKVCYYVAPQVWASRPGRVKKIRACVDTLCCVLPFEEKYFQDRGVNGVYVGHPMFDPPDDGAPAHSSNPTPAPLPGDEPGAPDRPSLGLMGGTTLDAPRVALFPGSRRAEIDSHMPPMLEVLSEIKGRFPRVTYVAAAPSEERAWQIRRHLRHANTPVEIRVGQTDAIIHWADLVLVKSGTATLQVARQGKPMIVLFAVPRWQWAVARHFLHTEFLALVNILAGRELVPEFIPFHGSPLPVARECIELLSRPDLRRTMSKELRELVLPLQPQNGNLAADRVADQVIKLV